MKLAIVGSRKYANRSAVQAYVQSLPKDTVVVTGGWPSLAGGYRVVEPRGIDGIAYVTAEACGLVTCVVAGSATKREHLAGIQRNPVIAEIGDAVTAFWDLKSSGTAHTLRMFFEMNKGVLVINEQGQSVPHWRQLLPAK